MACKILGWKFETFQASRSKDIVEIAKNGTIMAKTLPKHGPNNWKSENILLLGVHDS